MARTRSAEASKRAKGKKNGSRRSVRGGGKSRAAKMTPPARGGKSVAAKKAEPADVIKHRGSFDWDGIARQTYKDAAAHWSGVTRVELVAEPSSAELPFHVRYFEIAPGGFSTQEFHAHEHVVMVACGRGSVDLEGKVHDLVPGDIVRVRSRRVHQFRNPSANEPFGFYCIVAADRDRPTVVSGAASACEWPGPASLGTKKKLTGTKQKRSR